MLNKLKQTKKKKKRTHTHTLKECGENFAHIGFMLNEIRRIVQWSNRSGLSHYIINNASVMSRSVTAQGIQRWARQAFICITHSITMVSGILSPQHSMSSVCGWSVTKGCHKYTEQAVVDGWRRVVRKLGSWARGVTTHHINHVFYETLKCYRMLAPFTLGITPHPGFHTVQQLSSNQHVPDGWIYLW